MYQGTTPTLTFKVPGYDLTDKSVFVSIKSNGGETLTKTGDSLDVSYNSQGEEEYSLVELRLTQQETLRMRTGDVICQIRFIDSEGNALATQKATVNVNDVIYKAVIQHA